MLVLKILNGYADGRLDIHPVGSSCTNSVCAEKGWKVKWIVQPGSIVDKVLDIKKKSGPGAPVSDPIFQKGPYPAFLSGKRKWKARIDSNAQTGWVYHYDIVWQTDKGTKKIFDPKIAIMPTGSGGVAMLLPLIAGSMAVIGLAALLLRRRKTKRLANNQRAGFGAQ